MDVLCVHPREPKVDSSRYRLMPNTKSKNMSVVKLPSAARHAARTRRLWLSFYFRFCFLEDATPRSISNVLFFLSPPRNELDQSDYFRGVAEELLCLLLKQEQTRPIGSFVSYYFFCPFSFLSLFVFFLFLFMYFFPWIFFCFFPVSLLFPFILFLYFFYLIFLFSFRCVFSLYLSYVLYFITVTLCVSLDDTGRQQ